MQAKSKLLIALSFVSIVLASVAISMVAVFASVNQTVQSLVRVNYFATGTNHVTVDVSANKYFKTDEPIAFTGGTDGVVTFDSESSDSQSLTTEATTLTSTNLYVVYEFKFENNGVNAVNAYMTASNLNNLKMFYTTPTTTRKTNIYTAFDETDYTEGTTIPVSSIALGATAYVYVAIKVDFIPGDASFNQSFAWTIADAT